MTRVVRVALLIMAAVTVLLVMAVSMLIAGGASEAAVVEGPIPVAVPVETTVPATVEQELVIASPQVGDVVTSPLIIEGHTTARQLGYRLFGGGDLPLAEGTIVVDGEGTFSTTVEFTNTCCIEMTLEVFDMEPDGGLGVTLPLAYPESS